MPDKGQPFYCPVHFDLLFGQQQTVKTFDRVAFCTHFDFAVKKFAFHRKTIISVSANNHSRNYHWENRRLSPIEPNMRKIRRFLSGDELEKRIIRYFQRPHRLNITPYVREEFSSHCLELTTNHKELLVKMREDSMLTMRKVIFVGESAVGKTSLITKFYYGEFDSTYMSTLGIDFQLERFVVLSCEHRLQLWDTAGQERYRAMAIPFYRGASTIVSVFDMSNPSTIASALNYISIARLHSETARNSPCPTFLVGNKLDLLTPYEYRSISEQGQKMAREINAEYYEVSCKDTAGVTKLFRRIALVNFEDHCAGIDIPIELNPIEKLVSRIFRLKNPSSGPKRSWCFLH